MRSINAAFSGRNGFTIVSPPKRLPSCMSSLSRYWRPARLAVAHGTGGTLGVAHSGATLVLGVE